MASNKRDSSLRDAAVCAAKGVHSEGPAVVIQFKPAKLSGVLAIIVGLLALAHVGGWVSTYVYGHASLLGWVRMFNLDEEANAPTYYSSFLLLSCSSLLFLIGVLSARCGDRYHLCWKGLGTIFLFLSIDETAQIHEILLAPVEQYLPSLNILPSLWVLPYGAAALVALAIFVPILVRVPAKVRWAMVLAGFIYVGGAAGVDQIAGIYLTTGHQKDSVFGLVTLVEESMEMLGLVVFVYALTSYIMFRFGGLALRPLSLQPATTQGRPSDSQS
jgi:hypothetical protein